ncbi:hypothetical protein BGX27_008546 [Mortierella sp. AM989]|nr:hypothetical protein BGX27_008546 [Mortierella sp. AM989]
MRPSAISLRPRLAASAASNSNSSHPSSSSSTSIWPAVSIACIAILSASSTILPNSVADAAPAKHTPAPKNVVHAMNVITISATSALPLQLQIEAQAAGAQKLAYLPTSGPELDFYYLNYRPTYIAGESKIDFWMLTPQGTQAPKSASLELYDEMGKIRLAVLVPEGTEVPKNLADKHEPFLWKSWQIPQNIKSDFDFSEKFRIVLKTSDSKNVVEKRADGGAVAVTTVQDRQFRIKGLQASPGGKPHPAKVNVNSVAVAAPNKATANTNTAVSVNGSTNNNKSNTNTERPAVIAGDVNSVNNKGNTSINNKAKAKASGAKSAIASSVALPLMIVAATTFASLC